MLKSDYSTTNESTEIPRWVNHENINFDSSEKMSEWVADDKVNFMLSDKVYDAMIYCLTENLEELILATINVKGETSIDVIIRKSNFQKILSSYVERLLKVERYEKLAQIKTQIQNFDLEI